MIGGADRLHTPGPSCRGERANGNFIIFFKRSAEKLPFLRGELGRAKPQTDFISLCFFVVSMTAIFLMAKDTSCFCGEVFKWRNGKDTPLAHLIEGNRRTNFIIFFKRSAEKLPS